MKITDVKTYVLEAMLGENGFGWSQRVTDRRQTVICEVSTDAGIQGLGEAFYFGGPAKIAASLIEDALGPLIAGRNPLDNAVIWDFLYSGGYSAARSVRLRRVYRDDEDYRHGRGRQSARDAPCLGHKCGVGRFTTVVCSPAAFPRTPLSHGSFF